MYYIIGRDNCTWCNQAKAELEKDNTAYVYKNLSTLSVQKQEQWKDFIKNELGMTSVPVVFNVIGGFIELKEEREND